MDKKQEMAVAQMREAVEKLGSSTQGYGDVTVMRFLIGRSMDKEKAAKMFVQWQKWRASFVPLNYIPDSEVAEELNGNKIFLQGISRKGHPLMLVKVNEHLPSKDQLQFKKFVVHVLDKLIASGCGDREIGNEKLVGVLDLQQISYKNIDVRGLINGFQLLQIMIVTNDEERRGFIGEVGKDVLPEEYGGQARLTLIQDVKVKPLEMHGLN